MTAAAPCLLLLEPPFPGAGQGSLGDLWIQVWRA